MIRREPELHEAIVALNNIAAALQERGQSLDAAKLGHARLALEWAAGLENEGTERFGRLLADGLRVIRFHDSFPGGELGAI